MDMTDRMIKTFEKQTQRWARHCSCHLAYTKPNVLRKQLRSYPLPTGLPPVVSVTHGQPRPDNIKQKMPELNNLCFNLHAILSSMMEPHLILLSPACEMTPPPVQCLPTVDAPAPWSLSHLHYQTSCCGLAVRMLKSP